MICYYITQIKEDGVWIGDPTRPVTIAVRQAQARDLIGDSDLPDDCRLLRIDRWMVEGDQILWLIKDRLGWTDYLLSIGTKPNNF